MNNTYNARHDLITSYTDYRIMRGTARELYYDGDYDEHDVPYLRGAMVEHVRDRADELGVELTDSDYPVIRDGIEYILSEIVRISRKENEAYYNQYCIYYVQDDFDGMKIANWAEFIK